MIFPKIKKKIRDFFVNEQGRISKKSLLRMGLIAAAVSAVSSNPASSYEVGRDLCKSVCDDISVEGTFLEGKSPITASLQLSSGMDVNRNYYTRTQQEVEEVFKMHLLKDFAFDAGSQPPFKRIDANGKAVPYTPSSGKFSCANDDHDPLMCSIILNDLHLHVNSIALKEQGTGVVAQHKHAIRPANHCKNIWFRADYGDQALCIINYQVLHDPFGGDYLICDEVHCEGDGGKCSEDCDK